MFSNDIPLCSAIFPLVLLIGSVGNKQLQISDRKSMNALNISDSFETRQNQQGITKISIPEWYQTRTPWKLLLTRGSSLGPSGSQVVPLYKQTRLFDH